MGHSIGDGIIVAALAAAFVAYFYFKHVERRRRLEIVHQERVEAMAKGIPLPELPLDPPKVRRPPDPRAPLLQGIVWMAFGVGSIIGLRVFGAPIWLLPLPLALLGAGLILYYFLAGERAD